MSKVEAIKRESKGDTEDEQGWLRSQPVRECHVHIEDLSDDCSQEVIFTCFDRAATRTGEPRWTLVSVDEGSLQRFLAACGGTLPRL